MNTKILVSLLVIGLTAIAIGGGAMTGAWFSDTETSSGNTFTAGAIDLKVDNNCSYNGVEQSFCTWAEKDLETGDVFFNFTDVKPGDYGEDTISFNLTSNPAWACLYVDNITDSDNGCTDPELEAEPNCGTPDNGELDENLYLTVWIDNDCDNKLDNGEVIIINNTPLSDYIDGQSSVVVPVADNSTSSLMEGPLPAGEYCIGVAWCLGTFTANGGCDGSNVGNAVQTDKVGADLKFEVVQARNNPDFVCSSPS